MEVIIAEIAKVISIFGMAWFSFWAAIPAGLALGLHPLAIILITTSSYLSGILIFIIPSQTIRTWAMNQFGKRVEDSTNDDRLIIRLWHRYGVMGFGLIAPMTVGAQIGTVLGIALNIPRRRLVVWMTVGVMTWAVGLTLLAVAGVSLVAES